MKLPLQVTIIIISPTMMNNKLYSRARCHLKYNCMCVLWLTACVVVYKLLSINIFFLLSWAISFFNISILHTVVENTHVCVWAYRISRREVASPQLFPFSWIFHSVLPQEGLERQGRHDKKKTSPFARQGCVVCFFFLLSLRESQNWRIVGERRKQEYNSDMRKYILSVAVGFSSMGAHARVEYVRLTHWEEK